MKTPYLKFYISKKEDKEYEKKYFPIFREIFGKKEFERMKMELKDVREKNLEKEKEKVEKEWRRIENKFFEVIAKEFGEWKRKVYFCHISASYICGGGYEYPKIIVFPFAKHVKPLQTIMHELLHLHLIEDLKELNIKPKNFLEFNELAVAFMAKRVKNFNISLLFPNKKIERKFYTIDKKLGNEKVYWKEFLEELGKILN